MAKFLCICGEVLSTSGTIPHPLEYRFMSDVDLDSLTGDVNVEELYLGMSSFFRCPTSGHLWVFWDGFEAEPTPYSPADHEDSETSPD